jgi:hypothetical protein
MMPQNIHFANQGQVKYIVKALRLCVPQAYTQWSGVSIRQEKNKQGRWIKNGHPLPIKVSFVLGKSSHLLLPLKLKYPGGFEVLAQQLPSAALATIRSLKVSYQFEGKHYELWVD